MNKKLLIKLEKKKTNNFKVQPIFQNNKDRFLLDDFLIKQKSLNKNEVMAILEVNFLKNRPIGYVLIDDQKKIIGFLGTIFSKRALKERTVEHCYLHSWVVLEKYRLEAFKLIIPVIKKDIFISTYSPIKSLEGLYKKFGFEENFFFSKFVMLFPFFKLKENNVILNEDSTLFSKYLTYENKIFLKDHKTTNTKKIFIYFDENINNNIFIIVKKSIKKSFLPVLEIIYISDLSKFKFYEKKITFELIKKFNTLFFKFNYFGEKDVLFESCLFKKIIKKNVYYLNKPKDFNFDVLYSEFLG
jgi:hypothetical protein